MDVHRNRDPNFICLKWSLFTITLVMFVISICLAAFSGKIVDKYYCNDSEQSEKDLVKFLIDVGVASDLISFSGLYGSYKEHYCSTVTFFVFMNMSTIDKLKAALQNSSLWSSAVISFSITCLAFTFALQLKIRRKRSVSNTVGPQQGQTVNILMVRNYCSDSYNHSAQQEWSPPQKPPRYAQ